MIFEHDGVPFTSLELAALLSGGSSKEFESEVTTGRFGTGFLVTHVLAERTTLRGVLSVGKGYEEFELRLDRGGDEQAILANIEACNDAIRAARTLTSWDDAPSARFEYELDDIGPMQAGLDALTQALPYLYATRPDLGPVGLLTEHLTTWSPEASVRHRIDGGYADERQLAVRSGEMAHKISAFRFSATEDAVASALLLVEQRDTERKVVLLQDDAPKIYREYPLRGSTFLPINFVLDGKFDPDQERSRLLMTDRDKALLGQSFAAAIAGAKWASELGWEGAHLLARASEPSTAFDPTNNEELQWWCAVLLKFADSLAHLALVQCGDQRLPAISSGGRFADFIMPSLLASSSEAETTVSRMWPLVKAAADLNPPSSSIAADWTQIAEGWGALGLHVARITVERLAECVRAQAGTLGGLRINGDRTEWLARFIDIVGECWSRREGVDLVVLTDLLPDQNGQLHSPLELRRDSGIAEELKEICAQMGFDIRGHLLLTDLRNAMAKLQLTHAENALVKALPTEETESEVLEKGIGHLNELLPEDERCDQDTAEAQAASVRLLRYLAASFGDGAARVARRMPLITSNRLSARWSHERMMMAPVHTWHPSAQPFANAYPPGRVLSDAYAPRGEGGNLECLQALINFGIAIPDPIWTDTPADLKERRLAAIATGDTEGVVVSNHTFSQIALLQPEVLNRCQEGEDEARALLGLVLCHVAPHDSQWEELKAVAARRAREDVQIQMYGALWLADLKFRAWVPVVVPGEGDKPNKMVATAATLEHLLDPAWLDGNDAAIRLLSRCFGFDELELRLLGVAKDATTRQELRNGLAKLIESGGPDPALYLSLAEELEARRRQAQNVARFRRLGLGVQDAIRSALESYGLKLELIDKGFDFKVELPAEDVLEEASFAFDVGPYLLEVKATTTGDARLTPTQAITAADRSSRFALCVVDLRGLSEEELDAEWTASRVEPIAKIVSDVGENVGGTCSLIRTATQRPVPITNELALRYRVPVAIWGAGGSISEWVARISGSLGDTVAQRKG